MGWRLVVKLSCHVACVRVDAAAQPLKSLAFFSLSQSIFLLEASSPAQVAAVVKHVVAVRIERPVAAFARLLVISRHLDETLVQRQVVSDRVLPTLLVLAIVRKPAHIRISKPLKHRSIIVSFYFKNYLTI